VNRIGRSAALERSFSQGDFDEFAVISGDDNPIHTDADFASRTDFGRTVAHGLLLCSVLRGLVERLAPGQRLLEQSVMFPAPTYAGETLRFSAVSDDGDSTRIALEVRRLADDVVTCLGHCRVAP